MNIKAGDVFVNSIAEYITVLKICDNGEKYKQEYKHTSGKVSVQLAYIGTLMHNIEARYWIPASGLIMELM